jgi:putative ABC transport system substrate-binding protein
VKRREFIAGLGGAVTWPLAARAHQPATPVIGYLSPGTADSNSLILVAFRRGLAETGYVEGQNVAIEYRDAEGQPALAADLVRRKVAVIVAGPNAAAIAAKAATATIPIVFSGGGDPVKLGLVASLSRPGGNLTGVTNFASDVEAKRFGLLCEFVPAAALIAVLVSGYSPNREIAVEELRTAARVVGRQITTLTVGSEGEIDTVFADLVKHGAGALFVAADVFFTARRDQLIALAARFRLPASYFFREFVEAGGLMSYGANRPDGMRQVGVYVGRILKGERPADLPVQLPTRLQLVINLKTARTLGIDVPPTLLALADEVIE